MIYQIIVEFNFPEISNVNPKVVVTQVHHVLAIRTVPDDVYGKLTIVVLSWMGYAQVMNNQCNYVFIKSLTMELGLIQNNVFL